VAPLKKNEKNKILPPLFSTTFINKFEGSYGMLGKGKKSIVVNNIGSICPKNK